MHFSPGFIVITMPFALTWLFRMTRDSGLHVLCDGDTVSFYSANYWRIGIKCCVSVNMCVCAWMYIMYVCLFVRILLEQWGCSIQACVWKALVHEWVLEHLAVCICVCVAIFCGNLKCTLNVAVGLSRFPCAFIVEEINMLWPTM